MGRNLAIALGAVLLWTFAIPITEGMVDHGERGADLAAMVRGFTLTGGHEAARLSPVFAAAAWLPYVLTDDVILSFRIVNAFALAALVAAACVLLDRARVGVAGKLFVAAHAALVIAFAQVAGLTPFDPSLSAVALLMVAVAASEGAPPLVTMAAHVAAVATLPIGLAAPLYGAAKRLRAGAAGVHVAVLFAPAIAAWLLVQWWARGGLAGAVSDFVPGVLVRPLDVWLEPPFLAFALYFLVTTAGGLSLLLLAHPRSWWNALRAQPEVLVLAAALAVHVLLAAHDAPLAFGFLLPVWVFLFASWNAQTGRASYGWLAAALLLTVVTQRPFIDIDVSALAAEWAPYESYRRGVEGRADLWERWIPRLLIASMAVWAMAVLRPRDIRAAAVPAVEAPRAMPEPPAWLHAVLAAGTRVAGAVDRALFATVTRRRLVAYGGTAVVALGIIRAIWGIPLSLTDFTAVLFDVEPLSVIDVFLERSRTLINFRPMYFVQMKLLLDASMGEHYFLVFKTAYAVQIVAMLMLCVAVLRVQSRLDLLAAACAVSVLIGMHTMTNVFMQGPPNVLLCTALALALVFGDRATGWRDGAAVVLLAYAALFAELGLLLWVVYVGGRLLGCRGVSWQAVAASTLVVMAYLAYRMVVLNPGGAGFESRETGFGLFWGQRDAILPRVGGSTLLFYAYNVVSSALTVLFSEPRQGFWYFVDAALQRNIRPWLWVNILSSLAATTCLAWFVAARARAWLRREFDHDDRLVLIFFAVLAGNAALGFGYTRDVIMAPAGMLYALAVYAALKFALRRLPQLPDARQRAVAVVLVILAVTWPLRVASTALVLRDSAFDGRNDWAEGVELLQQRHQMPTDHRAELVHRFRRDALATPVPNPRLVQPWLEKWKDGLY
jgi:hypothetical protein